MATHRSVGAAASGQVTPKSDEAPAGSAAQGFKGLAQQVSLNSRSPDPWPQGARATALLLSLLILAWLLDSARPR